MRFPGDIKKNAVRLPSRALFCLLPITITVNDNRRKTAAAVMKAGCLLKA
jgi:hypothetical protein